MHPDDVVLYDEDGYPALKEFLRKHNIRHVLLTGYATDRCFCKTTAGYENLSKEFNVFLVGDSMRSTGLSLMPSGLSREIDADVQRRHL